MDAWADAIDEILDAHWAWVAATKWEPGPDSPLEVEACLLRRQYGPGGSWDGDAARSAVQLSSMFQSLAAQHLEAVRGLLQTRQVITPLAPVIRSCFEAVCRTSWLLEPLPRQSGRVSFWPVRDRAARLFAIRLEDTTRAKTVAYSLGHSSATQRGQALHKLRKQIIPGLFYDSERFLEKDGTITLRGHAIPGFRASAETFEGVHQIDWKAAGAYDYLSNASHPTPSTIFEITSARPDGSRRFEIEDVTYPIRVCRFGVIGFLHAWDLVAKYLDKPSAQHDRLYALVDALPEN